MAYINEPYKFVYVAKNFTSGLTDVKLVVYKPNMVKLGVYDLIEVNAGDGKGVYYYDFNDADIPGTYIFVCNSASCPLKDARTLHFDSRLLNAETTAEVTKNAIFDELVEGDVDTKEALRIMLAVLAGKTYVENISDIEANVVFRNITDTKNKVIGTIKEQERIEMGYSLDP